MFGLLHVTHFFVHVWDFVVVLLSGRLVASINVVDYLHRAVDIDSLYRFAAFRNFRLNPAIIKVNFLDGIRGIINFRDSFLTRYFFRDEELLLIREVFVKEFGIAALPFPGGTLVR